jgi:hypothetical protein
MRVQEVLDVQCDRLHIDTSFLEPRNIHMPAGQTLADVQPLIEDSIGEVVVSVPHDSVTME